MQTLYGLIKIQVRRTRHTCLGNYVSNMPGIFISLLSVKTAQHYYLSRKVQLNKTNSLVLQDLHNPSIISIISWRDKEGRTLSLPSNPPAPRPEKAVQQGQRRDYSQNLGGLLSLRSQNDEQDVWNGSWSSLFLAGGLLVTEGRRLWMTGTKMPVVGCWWSSLWPKWPLVCLSTCHTVEVPGTFSSDSQGSAL